MRTPGLEISFVGSRVDEARWGGDGVALKLRFAFWFTFWPWNYISWFSWTVHFRSKMSAHWHPYSKQNVDPRLLSIVVRPTEPQFETWKICVLNGEWHFSRNKGLQKSKPGNARKWVSNISKPARKYWKADFQNFQNHRECWRYEVSMFPGSQETIQNENPIFQNYWSHCAFYTDCAMLRTIRKFYQYRI